jgi:hypothetical protein
MRCHIAGACKRFGDSEVGSSNVLSGEPFLFSGQITFPPTHFDGSRGPDPDRTLEPGDAQSNVIWYDCTASLDCRDSLEGNTDELFQVARPLIIPAPIYFGHARAFPWVRRTPISQ